MAAAAPSAAASSATPVPWLDELGQLLKSLTVGNGESGLGDARQRLRELAARSPRETVREQLIKLAQMDDRFPSQERADMISGIRTIIHSQHSYQDKLAKIIKLEAIAHAIEGKNVSSSEEASQMIFDVVGTKVIDTGEFSGILLQIYKELAILNPSRNEIWTTKIQALS
jgi:hypothetical protein